MTSIVRDMTDAEYHQLPSLSASGAKLLLDAGGPAKYREQMDNPPPPKPVFDFGTLVHTLVLGKGADLEVLDPAVHGLKPNGTVADVPSMTGMWKKAVAAAREAGKLPVSLDEYNAAKAMADTVRQHPVAGPLLADGEAEESWFATDPDTDVKLRARPDWQTTRDGRLLIVDYKTAADASPIGFERAATKFKYHVQAAMYRHVSKLLGIDADPAFLFVAQEKQAPYLVCVHEFDAESMAEGERQMRRAIELFADCMRTGVWPGYEPVVNTMTLPDWAFDEMEIAI